MKRRSLVIVAALGLSLGLSSCGNSGEVGKQQLFNNASYADTDAFNFLKKVHEKGTNAIEHAKFANDHGASGDVKALNDRVLEVFPGMLAEMETLAISLQVILPDPGAQVFNASEAALDSTLVFDSQAYMANAQTETGRILEEFTRASRNTVKSTRSFASEKLPVIKEIYTLAGGHIDESAQH